jgi:4-amino-4-deoxy-L-arabinose transferase-like glycosyltransferase
VTNRYDKVLWAILALASVLLFWGLGDRCLWQDEAETALLGRNILRFGRPIAFDGVNVISQEASKEFGPDYLWRWSPWIQFYIAAGSFAVLGQTTLAARLPFTFLAFLAILLTYHLARRLFGSVGIARLAALALVLSVPFLLYARQARWHGPAYLLLACLFLCLTMIRRSPRWGALGFAAFAVLLFYTNFFVAIGVLAAVAVAIPLYARDRRLLAWLAVAYALAALPSLPAIFFFNSFKEGGSTELATIYKQFRIYGAAYLTFVMPLPAIALLVYLVATNYRKRNPSPLPFSPAAGARGAPMVPSPPVSRGAHQGEGEGSRRQHVLFLLAFSFAYLLYLSVGPWMMFRYLTVLLVPAAILLGVALGGVLRWNRLIGVAVLLTLLSTNAIHLTPLGYFERTAPVTYSTVRNFPSIGPVGFPLACYLYELAHPMQDPEAVLVEYLRQHARPDDVVLAQYGDLPLQFYTGLRVVGGMQGQPLPTSPDWILQRGFILSSAPGKDVAVRDFIVTRIPIRNYVPVLTAPDLMLGNNPEPQYHLYASPPNISEPPPRAPPPFVLWHRK